MPAYLSNANQKLPIVLSTSFTKNTPAAAEALKWALEKGFSVDIDVQTNLKDSDSEWETLEDLFAKAMPHESEDPAPKPKGKVVLCTLSVNPYPKLPAHFTYSQRTCFLLRTIFTFRSSSYSLTRRIKHINHIVPRCHSTPTSLLNSFLPLGVPLHLLHPLPLLQQNKHKLSRQLM